MDRFELPIFVNRDDLVRQLRINLADHRSIFLRAIERYRVDIVRRMNERVDEIRDGKTLDSIVRLPVPEDHSADYERAIRMLERHQREEVELNEGTYRQFFDDDWDWKDRWMGNTASYVR